MQRNDQAGLNCLLNLSRKIIFAVQIGTLVLLLSGCQTEANTPPSRIGILVGVNNMQPITDGFKEGLSDQGYIEGKDVQYDVQVAEADPQRELEILKKFVSDQVDIIVTFPTGPSQVAKEVTLDSKTPVVFIFAVTDGTGLVDDLSNPGSNLTGVRYPAPELVAKRFELLLEVKPDIKSIWVAYDPDYPTTALSLEVLQDKAKTSNINLIEVPISSFEDIAADLDKRSAQPDPGVDAIFIMPDLLSQSEESWAIIHKFADENNIPVCGTASISAENGALFSYAPNMRQAGIKAAGLAVQILQGTDPGSIPILTADGDLHLNQDVADHLGITFSDSWYKLAESIYP